MFSGISSIKSFFQGSFNSETKEGADQVHGDSKQPAQSTAPDNIHTTFFQSHEGSSMTTAVTPRQLRSRKPAEKVLTDIDRPLEVIPLDDELASSSAGTSIESPPSLALATKLVRGRKDRPKSTTSPIPTRKLGGNLSGSLCVKKKDAPVIIPDPMEEDMDRRSKFMKQTHGAYKPMNTLDRTQPANTHTRFLDQTKSRSRFEDNKSAANTKPPARDTEHYPVKKQRTGPSPKDGHKEHPVNIDDSQEFDGFSDDVRVEEEKPKTSTGVEIPKSHQSNRASPNSPSSYPYQAAINDIFTKTRKQASNYGKRTPADSTPINGKAVTIDDSDDDGDDFTKPAAKRKATRNSSPQRPTPNTKKQILQDPRQVATKQSPTLRNGYSLAPESPDPIQEIITTSQQQPEEIPRSQRKGPTLADRIKGNPNNRRLSRPSQGAAALSDPEDANVESFPIKDIAGFFVIRKSDYYLFYVDRDRGVFWLSIANPTIDSEKTTGERSVSKIQRIVYGVKSPKLFFKLSKSHQFRSSDFVVDLASPKKAINLLNLLVSLNDSIQIRNEDDEYLDKVFNNKVNSDESFTTNAPNDAIYEDTATKVTDDYRSPYFTKRSTREKRKMTDHLDEPTVIRAKCHREALAELPPSPHLDGESMQDEETTSHHFLQRPTRSQTLRGAQTEKPRYRSPSPRLVYSKRVGLGPKWVNDLVYPRDGKKRETVEYGDLFRLDEDEFLNDTLIGFFSRYIQHELELHDPVLLKKMHFFNSYFFDTLTKNTKVKKDVNHLAVSRWTKNINIFTREFIVVPVNDNLHWYLAIICNLPEILKKKKQEVDDDADDGVKVLDETSHEEQGQRTKQTQESFKEMSLDDKEISSQTKSRNSSQAESTPTKAKGRKKKEKPRRSLPKYDTNLPIIITLDSLAQPRSAAISALKQWVVLEAEARENITVEKDEIKGMTAKGIPSQQNYSDCGLYMCMYLEQFLADPRGFIRKILQREEGDIRWPKLIKSEDLRSRLRDLLMELHRRQEGVGTAEIPPLGKIMVELREASPELIASTPPSSPKHSVRSSISDLDGRAIREGGEEMEERFSSRQLMGDDQSPQIRTIETRREERHSMTSNLNDPIILDNDSPEKHPRRNRVLDGKLPPFKPHYISKLISVETPDEPQMTQMLHSNPQELADQMKAARANPAHKTRAKTESPQKRHNRNNSASTELLSGLGTYARFYEEEKGVTTEISGSGDVEESVARGNSASELDGEVPETQQEIEDRIEYETRGLRAQWSPREATKRHSEEEMLLDFER